MRFARDIDASVCAEGIETLEDLVRLADLDVAYGQGYVIARPAADWPAAHPEAARACSTSFVLGITGSQDSPTGDLHEHALEQILTRVGAARTVDDLAAALPSIATELRADDVTVHWRSSDPRRAPAPR